MEPKTYFGTLIDDHLGIITLNAYTNMYSFSKELSKITKKKIYLICGLWWTIETPLHLSKIIFRVLRNKILFPNIKVSILCNTERERSLLRIFGINAIFCNHNSFIDERIFTIDPEATKTYDAVYNAVLEKFKRHSLCRKIKRLSLITYKFENKAYKSLLDRILTNNPTWLNYESEPPRFLNTEEIVTAYNASRVGLALSKEEGAMYASTEYLLCGLPVVSTKSKGGRDIFYNDLNSVIVNELEDEVESAIQKLSSRASNGQKIRDETLKIMYTHRQNLSNFLQNIYEKEGVPLERRKVWSQWYKNKLRNEINVNQIAALLSRTNTEN